MKIEERIDMYIGEDKLNELTMNGYEEIQLKNLFAYYFTHVEDKNVSVKSYFAHEENMNDLGIAKQKKLVKTSKKVPKGVYGYEDMKDRGEVLVYPTKLGLQVMQIMQKNGKLPTDKKIKI